MKYRIVECNDGKSQWYEVYYRFMFMWFPVTTVFFSNGIPATRMFATKEQAEYWVSLRVPVATKLEDATPAVERKVISEYDH